MEWGKGAWATSGTALKQVKFLHLHLVVFLSTGWMDPEVGEVRVHGYKWGSLVTGGIPALH